MSVCKRKKRKTDYESIEEKDRKAERMRNQWIKHMKNSMFGGFGGQFFGSVDGQQIPLDNIQSMGDIVGDDAVDGPENFSVEFSVAMDKSPTLAELFCGQGHGNISKGKKSPWEQPWQQYFSDPILEGELEDMPY